MDAITLLKQDHKTVEELFKRFEKLGPRAKKGKADVVEQIIKELSIHAAIEEAVLYPAIRGAVERQDVEDMVLESLEEHHVVKWTLSELDKMSDSLVDAFMEQQKIRDKGELQRLLAQEGMTLAEFKRRLLENYAPEEVLRYEVGGRVAVGDKEVDASGWASATSRTSSSRRAGAPLSCASR